MSFYSSSNTEARPIGLDLSAIMRLVYLWVGLGLAVSFGVAYFVGNAVLATLQTDPTGAMTLNSPLVSPVVMFGSAIVYLVMALTLQPVILRASPAIGSLFYLAVTAVLGFVLSSILLQYTFTSIALAFVTTAAMFGAMSIVGFTTKIDLSRMGSLLLMALVGLIIATIVNIFVHSTLIFALINYLGVLIFVGLTAYDTQWIKNQAIQVSQSGNTDMAQRLALIGAFHLFMDFINLFLYILTITGDRGGRR
ncbi:MAG: Bax inhibitor-1/YccA family protein [Chloroflexota bacterium]